MADHPYRSYTAASADYNTCRLDVGQPDPQGNSVCTWRNIGTDETREQLVQVRPNLRPTTVLARMERTPERDHTPQRLLR